MTDQPRQHSQKALAVEPKSESVSTAGDSKPPTIINGNPAVDTHPQSVADQKAPSQTLGRYQILGELGRGGMGAVYLAEDTLLKRRVALKIPQFEPSKAEQMQARFLREAQMAAKLSHPNICQTYDVAEIDGRLMMSMEYIDGKTLNAYTKPGKLLSDRMAASLVRKVALAVEVAHEQGTIHRDLKPGNIMLPKPSATQKKIEPKVMDFGLAKSLDARTTELTKSGMIVGTPCYMSKEQWSGKEAELGRQCDVYSLGVILYELLTGHLPYDVEDGEPATSWFVRLVTDPQIRPSERKPDVDASLSDIVMKAIAKEPQDRFASMAEFAVVLEAWLKGKPVTGHTMLGIQLGSLQGLTQKHRPRTATMGNWKHFIRKPLVMWGGVGGFSLLLLFGIGFWFRFKARPDGATVVEGGFSNTEKQALIADQMSTSDTTARSSSVGAKIEPKMLTAFPDGAVYKGLFRNYDKNGNQTDESELTVTILRRDGDKFESNWLLHRWNHNWFALGTVSPRTDQIDSAEGEFTNLMEESHPNEAGNSLNITFSEDRTQFSGVKRQLNGVHAGTRNEFEATLWNASAINVVVDPLHFGSEWTGELTADPGTGPVVNETTARVVERTTDGFTLETSSTHRDGEGTFAWRYQLKADEKHTFKVFEAELLKKTQLFIGEEVGLKLINNSTARLSGAELAIVITRPISNGTMLKNYRLKAKRPAVLVNTPVSDSEESAAGQISIEEVFPLGSTYTGQFGDDPNHIASSTVTAVEDGIATIRYRNNFAWWDLKFDIVDGEVRLRSVVGVGTTDFKGQRIDDVLFFNIRAAAPANESARNGDLSIVGTWDMYDPVRRERRDLKCRLDFHRNDQ